MENQRGGALKITVWWAWLIAIAAISAEPFLWEVRYFRVHGSLLDFRAIIAILLLLIPACYFWIRWRRKGWYRFELPVIAGGALCLALAEQARGMVVGALFFFSCVTTGIILARWLGIRFEGPAETIGIGFSVGAGAFIPVLFILGLLHAYYWPVFLVMLGAPLVLGWRDGRLALQAIGKLFRSADELPGLSHPLCGVAAIFLGAAVLCATMTVLSPSIIMDAVRMHLPDTQAFLAMHALEPVQTSPYSFYPQGFEVELAALYGLGGLPAAQMVSPAYFAAFVLLLVGIARLCGFEHPGIFAGMGAIVATPFILWDGSQAKNDIELALFQAAALYCCLRWRSTERRGWLMAGAFLLASSFCIKHIAAFGAVPLTLLFLAPLYRKPRAFRTAAMFVLCVAAFGFYWHVRTYLLTGDPLYPRRVEEAVRPKKSADKRDTWVHRRVSELWLVQFHDSRIGLESPLRSPMGIVLLALAPLALMAARRRDSSRRACWFFIGLYVLLWASRMTTLRYALAPIALLMVFVVAKAYEAYEQNWAIAPRLARSSITAVLGGALAFGLLGVILIEVVPGQLSLLAHRISRADYLRANLPGYAPLNALCRLDPHAAVLLIDSSARTYAPNPAKSAVVFNGPTQQERATRFLHAYDFQYAVLPTRWDSQARALLFQGWKADEIYKDRDWLGFRITRNP